MNSTRKALGWRQDVSSAMQLIVAAQHGVSLLTTCRVARVSVCRKKAILQFLVIGMEIVHQHDPFYEGPRGPCALSNESME